MSPDKRGRTTGKPTPQPQPPVRPDRNDPWSIVFFQRHADDDPTTACPGEEFLNACPPDVRRTIQNVLIAVAKAPPHRFAGGGYWEAMKGDMVGYYEVRVNGPRREHFRLFCVLDTKATEPKDNLLTVLCGAKKPFRTELPAAAYKQVRSYGEEYFARPSRSIR